MLRLHAFYYTNYMSSLHSLANKSLVIIFAYAPTGLGHLRVTDALYHGLPANVPAILLGSQDTSISAEYRFISIHPALRSMFVAVQHGFWQKVTTVFYRFYLRHHTHLLYQQLITIFDEHFELPETILIVATHFGLAHQLAAIKNRLENQLKVRIILVAQVTDDTPEPIWYIPNADCIFVPSKLVKERLEEYGKKNKISLVPFIINPYPVSPYLCDLLSQTQYDDRIKQVSPSNQTKIHVSIPISGAAIGTDFFIKLVDKLHSFSPRYLFHIVVKEAMYTRSFISEMLTRSYVTMTVSSHDRGTVDNYEQMYRHHVISLEITKPSEQTFKTLLRPNQVGGAILLFAEPVGQQEKDNLSFLKRHTLIPSVPVQEKVWQWATENKILTQEEKKTLFIEAHFWRGLQLPRKPFQTALFIQWSLEQGLFEAMANFHTREDDPHLNELGSDGVKQFWETIVERIHQPR